MTMELTSWELHQAKADKYSGSVEVKAFGADWSIFLLSLLSFSLGLSWCLDLWSESNVSGDIGESGT